MRLRPLFLLLCLAVLAACSSSTTPSVTTLQITDVKIGTGAEAVGGRTLTVHYTGWIYSANAPDHHGVRFDTSRDKGPFIFVLGRGQVVAGWDQGLVGMKVGGQRTLVIPPDLAYGNGSPANSIRANATLIFDIELLSVV